ncbi:MAG TPA: hypothetical protein VMF89_18680 [Polyangiales bacterium]|nr:hypothetical protein [Polyangiales bacterium]
MASHSAPRSQIGALRAQLTLGVRHGVALASLSLGGSCTGEQDLVVDAGASAPVESAEPSSERFDQSVVSHDDATSLDLPKDSGAALDAAVFALPGPDAQTSPINAAVRPGLEPYALNKLGCFGPVHDSGYYGQCCVSALCYTPESGAACAPKDEVSRLLPGYPPGSGACGCSTDPVTGSASDGPYARNAADDAGLGECCYLVGSITCTGRPLVIAGEVVIAAVVVRSGWAIDA